MLGWDKVYIVLKYLLVVMNLDHWVVTVNSSKKMLDFLISGAIIQALSLVD